MSRKADIVTQPEESKLESLDAEEIPKNGKGSAGKQKTWSMRPISTRTTRVS